ncbi:hypothetical protein DFO70_11151 [Cytobacillus firmus]|uniref:Uncharacterized protein n=2 Tax=Cytobacillus TaxID=2675230 RepID=A0A366JNC4_CYTFI|nr:MULTISPECIES: hypothetical protein [Cytobacillus]RBP89404.1 hypothetical protein DFO70_11151 [Cytobacillus firmus]TDX47369.1 hypothetical protein DFO72_101466 [Cytobacillus oceanisediminis]
MKLTPIIRKPEPVEETDNLKDRVIELEAKVKELEDKLNQTL